MTPQLDIFLDRPADQIGFRELPDAPQEARDIWQILHWRAGQERAILSSQIEQITGMGGAEVRHWVRWLVMRCHKPIRGSPHGYHVIASEDDVEREYQQLMSRGVKILARAARIRKYAPEQIGPQVVLALREIEKVGHDQRRQHH